MNVCGVRVRMLECVVREKRDRDREMSQDRKNVCARELHRVHRHKLPDVASLSRHNASLKQHIYETVLSNF